MSEGALPAWTQFRLETFGDPYLDWHDGTDFAKLRTLWRTRPELVEQMLREGLDADDELAASAIEHLVRTEGGMGGITPALESAIDDAQGTFRVRVAEVLLVLTGDQHWAGPVCEVLAGATEGFERADAAIALNGFAPSQAVVAALAGGVQDEEYLVRRDSAQSLLTLAHRHTTIEHEPALWAMIGSKASPRDWQQAADELTKPWARA
jgi:phytoene dehydrogenase-like protein